MQIHLSILPLYPSIKKILFEFKLLLIEIMFGPTYRNIFLIKEKCIPTRLLFNAPRSTVQVMPGFG